MAVVSHISYERERCFCFSDNLTSQKPMPQADDVCDSNTMFSILIVLPIPMFVLITFFSKLFKIRSSTVFPLGNIITNTYIYIEIARANYRSALFTCPSFIICGNPVYDRILIHFVLPVVGIAFMSYYLIYTNGVHNCTTIAIIKSYRC